MMRLAPRATLGVAFVAAALCAVTLPCRAQGSPDSSGINPIFLERRTDSSRLHPRLVPLTFTPRHLEPRSVARVEQLSESALVKAGYRQIGLLDYTSAYNPTKYPPDSQVNAAFRAEAARRGGDVLVFEARNRPVYTDPRTVSSGCTKYGLVWRDYGARRVLEQECVQRGTETNYDRQLETVASVWRRDPELVAAEAEATSAAQRNEVITHAVFAGDTVLLRGTINAGGSVFKALLTALIERKTSLVHWLLSLKPQIEPSDAQGLLKWALRARDDDMARWLLHHGLRASPSELCVAAEYGQLDIVRAFLESGTSANGPATDYLSEDASPLYFAARGFLADYPDSLGDRGEERLSVIRFLLAHGATVDSGRAGKTPLMMAARQRLVAAVQTLLEAGANPNATIGRESEYDAATTPLGFAITEERFHSRVMSPEMQAREIEILRLLLAKGAKPSRRGAHGKSALDFARQDVHDTKGDSSYSHFTAVLALLEDR